MNERIFFLHITYHKTRCIVPVSLTADFLVVYPQTSLALEMMDRAISGIVWRFEVLVLLKWLRCFGKWLMQMDAALAFLRIFTFSQMLPRGRHTGISACEVQYFQVRFVTFRWGRRTAASLFASSWLLLFTYVVILSLYQCSCDINKGLTSSVL